MNPVLSPDDIEFMVKLLGEAGGMGMSIQERGTVVRRKDDNTIVTQADTEIQEFLIGELSGRFPAMKFIHEENREKSFRDVDDNTLLAVIDPIDGTAVFSMGLPTWSVSVGVFEGFTPRYGFVFSPGCRMMFHNDDKRAYLNGTPVAVDRDMAVEAETNLFVTAEIFRNYTLKFPGKVRNLGSTALHGSLVIDNARNRTLAFIGRSYLWDWGGLMPLVLKAGGSLRYMSGKEPDVREIIANSFLLPEYCIAYSAGDFNYIRGVFGDL